MRRTVKDFRDRTSRAALMMGNMVRKVVLGATAGGMWAILGYEYEDVDTGATVTEGEDDDPVDTFQGIGIYARPATADNAEGILLHVGGEAEHPVLAAVRNEDARLRYVEEHGDVLPGEIAIFNSAGESRVIIKASGEIEFTVAAGEKLLVREKGGATDRLVTEGEFLRHVHATAATGSPSPPIPISGGPLKFTLSLEAEVEP